jgi:4-hydroxybenzoate polyprenyltransferase
LGEHGSALEPGSSSRAHDQADARQVPLVVDLDGTLVRSDLLIETLFLFARLRPFGLLMVPFWLAKGRAHLKQRLAQTAPPDVQTLPYCDSVIARLEAERDRGVPIILATGADQRLARAVATHLGLFDAVFASDGTVNLTGVRKRDRLVAAFGLQGFDYLGAERDDQPVREAARKTITPVPPGAKQGDAVGPTAKAYLQALRPYQWLKNSLVLIPLFGSHQLYEPEPLIQCLLAFVAFSLCASSAYLVNDLMDLPSDRHHPRKKQRPFASGRISPAYGAALIPILLAAGLGVAALLPALFLGVLVFYYALTLSYSVRLKDVVILDVLTLAGLYALRVMGGSAAVGIPPSAWLLAFCVFLFFSLAMVKRYAELVAMRTIEGKQAHARGYILADAELLAALGGASGYLSVLVLALYIAGDAAPTPAVRYNLIWLICLLLLYWISYVWLMAHRGRMHDDPLVFALRDPVSRALVVAMAVILFLAT